MTSMDEATLAEIVKQAAAAAGWHRLSGRALLQGRHPRPQPAAGSRRLHRAVLPVTVSDVRPD